MINKLKHKTNKGITLVALVVTIIVLLILAGIVISLFIGNNGIFDRAKEAEEESKKASLKEELEFEILDVQVEKTTIGENATKKEIAERLDTIGDVNNCTQEIIEGEYKNYEFWVDKNNKVTIGNRIEGEKPKGGTFVINHTNEEEIKICVWGEMPNGEVKIQSLSGLENSENTTETTSIYTVKENGTYYFRITGNDKRSIVVSCSVNKDTTQDKDLLSAIDKIEDSGIRKVGVIGKTENYSINTIKYDGDVILDGKSPICGATLKDNVYEFGCESDIATENKNAKSTVVLKVDGNLTISPQATIKAKGGTYGGPKGMIIYCTGTLTNNGSISMTARGAKAEGQDVYILKNEDETFEYIPKEGGKGRRKIYQLECANSVLE